MITRNFSLSKLRKILPLSISAYSCIKPICNSLPPVYEPEEAIPCTQTPARTSPSLIFFMPFSSPSEPPASTFSLTRDGNFDEATSHSLLVCPGCGVSMQDLDPKQPGFFIRPSSKKGDDNLANSRISVLEEPAISKGLKKGIFNVPVKNDNQRNSEKPDLMLTEKPVVCARCHSLRHYGKVKDPSLENLLPDFDFDCTVGRRLRFATGARAVVLMVVDASDFDGSFPRAVARLISRTIDENSWAWKEGKSGNVPRVVLVVTKLDLLPTSLSPTGLEHWVRTRARERGANKLISVHLVSAVRNWGVKNLVDDVVKLAGPRGNVWAIGAQNAGKSTLINAIAKSSEGKVSHLTEAAVPGTTLGIVRVEGVLPGNTKLFDTPGLLHPHQITTRLNREEQKLVHISKELRPRTYRIKAGQSVHIGGLLRMDVEKLSVDSIYVTVWASPFLPLHMGKKENASTVMEDCFGRQLQPPIGEGRVSELGQWVRKEFHIVGSFWDSSSVDIAAAGLGWFAIGLKGEALLGVWTYDGIDVVDRRALIPQKAFDFEVAGFTVSKIVSKADQALNKQRKNDKERKANLTTTLAM